MKKALLIIAMLVLKGATFAQQSDYDRMLNRFLSYVRIGSQSIDTVQDVFPMTEGQQQMALLIYNDIKNIKGVEVRISPEYYVYAKIPANTTTRCPSVAFMAHLDITPEAPGPNMGRQIRPQIHSNYDGGDIVLGGDVVLSPNSPQGTHLKDLVGKTIITSDGSTLLGADCKSGCAILVTLIEKLASAKKQKHGDVYFFFTQNEDVGKVAMRIDLNYMDKVPDILIDVDGNNYGEFSVANFTAENRTYVLKGNQAHSGDGKVLGYADARTAMAYFIAQLPIEVHPSNSEGMQGYIHCFDITQMDNKQDWKLQFRLRYFDKADSVTYSGYMNEAMRKTHEAFPKVEIEMVECFIQYDNVANSMYPGLSELIVSAAKKTGIPLKPTTLRAGTTCALMVAQGLPGGPCIYGGQQAVHSVLEWACIEELIDITGLCMNIVTEIYNLGQKK